MASMAMNVTDLVADGAVAHPRPRKLATLVAADIVDDVVRRGLVPGEVLAPEAEMTAAYGVGRATLREALRILESQGVIALKPGPHGGPVLRAVGHADIARVAGLYLSLTSSTHRDVLEALRCLEPVLAGRAAAGDPQPVLSVVAAALRDVLGGARPAQGAAIDAAGAGEAAAVAVGDVVAAARAAEERVRAVGAALEEQQPGLLDEPLRWLGA